MKKNLKRDPKDCFWHRQCYNFTSPSFKKQKAEHYKTLAIKQTKQ